MSGAVYHLLAEDAELANLGVETVETDYSLETRPNDGIFLIIRWGAQTIRNAIRHGPLTLSIWAHQPEEYGSDYTQINKILNRCQKLLENTEQVVGGDGIRVVEAAFQGYGPCLYDPGFKTICRSTTYRILLGMV